MSETDSTALRRIARDEGLVRRSIRGDIAVHLLRILTECRAETLVDIVGGSAFRDFITTLEEF